MTSPDLIALADQYIMGTYKRFPVVMSRGQGTRVWDASGKEYLDFVAGIAVCSLGHSHPKVAEAIAEQARTLMHVSNLYHIEAQIRYAELLLTHSFADKVFFCNSGAEANEAAIKLARKYGNEKLGEGRSEIITMLNSFHGRTLATITATGQEKFQKGFEPLPPGFRYVPFNNVRALEEAISDKTCAVLLEPIQCEGGVNVPDASYLPAVRKLCDERGILLIMDEVQVGMGRTGRLFAHEHDGAYPDIATLAKAIGNGFPLGAMMATDRVAPFLGPGTHASTFGGNPLAMASARATLEVLLQEGVLKNAETMGGYLISRLRELQGRHGVVKEVRGRGLIIGMELEKEAGAYVSACMEKGLLIASAGPNVLRFVPPLIISEADIDQAVHILDGVLEAE